MEDISVQKFYNLAGESIAERHRHFNQYLKELKETQSVDADKYFELLIPRTLQEELYRLKLLLLFGREQELLDTFLQANRIINKLLIKDRRFVEILSRIPAEQFVDRICPRISYVSRNDAVYKLSFVIADVDVGEKYFKSFRARYGLRAAAPLLVACGEHFVREACDEHRIRLNDRQLVHLHKKYPQFCLFYLKGRDFGDYPMFARHLCLNDMKTFHKLLERPPRIGKRAFGRFLAQYKKCLLSNPKCVLPARHKYVYNHVTRSEYRTYVKGWFPKPDEHFFVCANLRKCLELVPRCRRGELFFGVFWEVYGFDVWTNEEYMSEEVLELLALPERLKFKLGDAFLHMTSPQAAISQLKDKLKGTSDSRVREDLLKKMITCCVVNDDTSAFLELLQYFCSIMRNENADVRRAFVDFLLEKYPLEKLSGQHWSSLMQIVQFFDVSNDYFFRRDELYKKYVLHRFLDGSDPKVALKAYFKNQPSYTTEFEGKYERTAMLTYLELIPETFKKEEEVNNAKKLFLEWLVRYNKKHPKRAMSPFDYPDCLRSITAEIKEYFYSAFVDYILKVKPIGEEQRKFQEEFIEGLLKHSQFYMHCEAVSLLVKRRPDVYYLNPDFFFQRTYRRHFLFYEVSRTPDTKLFEDMKSRALGILENPKSGEEQISGAYTFLSYDPTFDFVRAIQKYIPPDCKVNVNDGEMKDMLEVQKGVLRALKNSPRPWTNMECILQFCKFDYLQYALEPLYFAMYHAPEQSLAEPLSVLIDRAVSVRKHATYLTTTLLTSRSVHEFLVSTSATEKNASLRKFVFKRIFKRFVDDQSENYWVLLRDHLDLLNLQDYESRHVLLSFDKVPRKYLAEYVELVWAHVSLRAEGELFDALVFLSKHDLSTLPHHFCDVVLKKSLFNKLNHRFNNTVDYAVNYLMHDQNLLDRRVDVIWELIEKHVDDPIHIRDVHNFLETLCANLPERAKEQPSAAKAVALKLKQHLHKLRTPFDKFELDLLVDTTLFRLAVKPGDDDAVAEFLLRQMSVALAKHDAHVFPIYARLTVEHLGNLGYSSVYRTLPLAEALLRDDSSTHVRLLCLRLMASKPDDVRFVRERHDALVEKIRCGCAPIVEVNLLKFLRDIKCEY